MRWLLLARHALLGAVVCGWFLAQHQPEWFGVDALGDEFPICGLCKKRLRG